LAGSFPKNFLDKLGLSIVVGFPIVAESLSQLAFQAGIGGCILRMGTKMVAESDVALVLDGVGADIEMVGKNAGRGAESFAAGDAQVTAVVVANGE